MKFSSSLKFNAVVDWVDEYIAYDTLKKYIYQLEREQHEARTQHHDLEANESTGLVSGASPDTDAVFRPLLDDELEKITTFYEKQERILLEEVSEVEELVKEQDDTGLTAARLYVSDGDDEDDDEDDDGYTRDPSAEPTMSKRRRRMSLSRISTDRVSHAPQDLSSPRRDRTASQSSEDNEDLHMSLASMRQQHPQSPSIPAVPEEQPFVTSHRPRTQSETSPHVARGVLSRLTDSIVSLGHGSRHDSASASGAGDTIWTHNSNYALDTQLLFKRRLTNLFVESSSLKSYAEMNYTGFRKVLKKYDKVTDNSLQSYYMHEVIEKTSPWDGPARARLAEVQDRLFSMYAKCVTRGDLSLARSQLKANLREHIAWERDTVWRQMIASERHDEGGVAAPVVNEKEVKVWTPAGPVRVSWKLIWGILAMMVFTVLLTVPTVEGEAAQRCLAILVFATILWATEVLPLFVTSLAIPPLLVWLRVIIDPTTGDQLTPQDATKWIFSQMFSPTLMLLIGGFTIAAALSKTNIDRILITRVLSLAGTRPSTVLLSVMGVACFASMWISNVAAPTLCFALVRPILRTLPPKSAFGPCLIIGIALAANIGGQSSPISSPQNLIALEYMDPPLDWARWFAVALPVSAVSIVLIWGLLLLAYKPARAPTGEPLEIKSVRATRDGFTRKQVFVALVCLGTIALWCVARAIEGYVGDMGIIAVIPIVAFFGTGVLKKDDFEHFLWSVVFLAMGGIALGKGVTSSGLLGKMDVLIRGLVSGMSPYAVVLILSMVVLVVSTFISHTIAAVLLVPIAQQVGAALPGNQANLLIFITGLICSTGMGMPVSGFPNQQAATQEDEMGQLYLTNVDFLKNGVPASIIATLVVATLGYLLMFILGI